MSPAVQKIKELMDQRCHGNQREFAKQVGCSQPVLSRILNGKQQPGSKLLLRVSNLPGLSTEDVASLLVWCKGRMQSQPLDLYAIPDDEAGTYADLLKRALINHLYMPHECDLSLGTPIEEAQQRRGTVWPKYAHTMVGWERLSNLQACFQQVLKDRIPGDFIETGVWRGGCCIFLAGLLKARGDQRRVWVCDSFQGLAKPTAAEDGLDLSKYQELVIPLEEVRANFKRYGLLDERVIFVPGWFKDTLHTLPLGQLSILRLDGDYYESTMTALNVLYPKLAPGGYCIIDDYCLLTCTRATDDYRAAHNITDPLVKIDQSAVFWRKS